MQLPPGYTERIAGDVTMIAHGADMHLVQRAVEEAGSLHAYAASSNDGQQRQGRGIAYTLNAGTEHWIVRHYQRGGAMASLLRDRYLRTGTPRPLAEMIVSEAARARGIATPRVTAAVIHEDGIFYRADIATSYLEHTNDLAALTLGNERWETEARIVAWRATGALLRMCFENGLVHPDLNLRNILVERAGTTEHAGNTVAYVIDLDRAHLRTDAHKTAVGTHAREHMLARFHRSRAKIEHQSGNAVSTNELRAFAEGLG